MQLIEHHHTDREKMRALPWALAQGMLNMTFAVWTFSGSVFLLFLNELGLPKGQIGMVLSLFPFCGLLALGFAPVAARLGWKRVFLWGFGIRKFAIAALLFLPIIILHIGHTAGVVFLFGIITIFAICRSIGETAHNPWSQQYVPNRVRGKFTGSYYVLSTLASLIAILIASKVIGEGVGLSPFLLLIGAGCIFGVLGVAVMWWVPGGEPVQEPSESQTHLDNMLQALRDHDFLAYLGGLGSVMIGTILLVSFLPLYMNEQLGLAPGTVVALDMAAMIGVGASSLFWGWAADHLGSRPVLIPSVGMLILVPLAWLLLPRNTPHMHIWCAALYFAYGAATSGFSIGSSRLLYNKVVPVKQSTAYTAVYYAWAGVTGGLAPLAAGAILMQSAGLKKTFGPFVVDAYALIFALAAVLLVLGIWLFRKVPPDKPGA